MNIWPRPLGFTGIAKVADNIARIFSQLGIVYLPAAVIFCDNCTGRQDQLLSVGAVILWVLFWYGIFRLHWLLTMNQNGYRPFLSWAIIFLGLLSLYFAFFQDFIGYY